MKDRRRSHPKPDLLLRFLQGETSRAENRTVVRHLLAGCRCCAAVTRAAVLADGAPDRGFSTDPPPFAEPEG